MTILDSSDKMIQDQQNDPVQLEVPAHLNGERIDRILAGMIDEVSRGRVASWIKKGCVTVQPRGNEKIKGAHKGIQAQPLSKPPSCHSSGLMTLKQQPFESS